MYTCNSCLKPTNKCWHSPPLLAFINTTAGLHFKCGCSQWSEPRVSCDDNASDRTIHTLFFVATSLFVPETNPIVSDISFISSICWWVPFQCHSRFVWVYSSCQVLHWSRSESCEQQMRFTGRWSWKQIMKQHPKCLHNDLQLSQLQRGRASYIM